MTHVEINRGAPIVSTKEIVVAAPVERVWEAHTRVADWPSWNPGITSAAMSAPLAVGSSFDWETAGLAIRSTIRELVPGRRIAWDGTVQDILGIHVWTFVPHDDGTLVRTEESWEGGVATAGPPEVQKALDDSLVAWLDRLKARAEERA